VEVKVTVSVTPLVTSLSLLSIGSNVGLPNPFANFISRQDMIDWGVLWILMLSSSLMLENLYLVSWVLIRYYTRKSMDDAILI
jgi:hypothetical protein